MSDSMILEAYKGNQPYLFVSYAHSDRDKVIPVIEELQIKGARVWYDDSLELTKDFNEEIGRSIGNCRLFIVF